MMFVVTQSKVSQVHKDRAIYLLKFHFTMAETKFGKAARFLKTLNTPESNAGS